MTKNITWNSWFLPLIIFDEIQSKAIWLKGNKKNITVLSGYTSKSSVWDQTHQNPSLQQQRKLDEPSWSFFGSSPLILWVNSPNEASWLCVAEREASRNWITGLMRGLWRWGAVGGWLRSSGVPDKGGPYGGASWVLPPLKAPLLLLGGVGGEWRGVHSRCSSFAGIKPQPPTGW